ncbi:ABC transporter permease [Listeria newyorkensis]|uniref:ABC transporter permease n=1 Tax=Listeria newyorkensis TaxID=1497681 RepID=A0ABX4XMT4_9LIST|nr:MULTISPECIES: ABC transporter permease [Listeria]KGL45910.1 ABC transporter permease [Listeriaceae bacterium FSL A5-0209]KGL43190.1 ABC transporter permease [Listeria newyorkensis]KMT62745.1 ABC transporter permease [Listeria newyorkensis]PNP90934.1 ABC transporter permease [Listeria newyorkensis]RQW65539.1 ABC transporter permease [Listeria sp. SHR_NRA_18]
MKFDAVGLFKKRFGSYMEEVSRYMRYMLNDHLLFVLIIGVGAFVYSYSGWVKTLTPVFPAIPLMVILLTAAIAVTTINTLLKRPDAVYLIVQEKAMNQYFKKANIASFWMQIYIFILVLAACMPMYAAVTGFSFSRFFPLLLVMLLIKLWNVYFQWETMKLENTDTTWLFTRVIVSAALLYLVLAFNLIWSIPVALVVLLASYVWMKRKTVGLTIKWEYLIDKEEARMNRFYRLANLFTDVPHLKGTVRRRAYLDFLYRPIPYAKEKSFAYLWSRTFVRTNEFMGLYVRLTVIAFLLLVFVQGFYLNIIFSLLFIYLTGFQFIPMLRHFDGQVMLKLYPIDDHFRRRSFIHFLRILLVAQALLFGIVGIAQNGSIGGVIILGINLAFVAVFTFVYVPYRVKKIYQ